MNGYVFCILNQKKLYKNNKELTQSGALIAKLINKTNKLKKGGLNEQIPKQKGNN